jgi:UDP-N-acetylmuramate: L-alanyl-gamma-D-glutamyl-meso-diaminopimelate ligase
LKAVRTRYPGRRVWAILEPRSNTLRRKVFQSELARSLAVADEVVLAGIFKSEAIPEHERLDPDAVLADLRAIGKPSRLLATADAIVESVAPELREGDVVVLLSNGGFGGIYEKLPAKLKSLHEVSTPA